MKISFMFCFPYISAFFSGTPRSENKVLVSKKPCPPFIAYFLGIGYEKLKAAYKTILMFIKIIVY